MTRHADVQARRDAILAMCRDGLRPREIAETLGVPLGLVRSDAARIGARFGQAKAAWADAAIRDVLAGAEGKDIAAAHGVRYLSVCRHANNAGLSLPVARRAALARRMIQFGMLGESSRCIADELGISQDLARRVKATARLTDIRRGSHFAGISFETIPNRDWYDFYVEVEYDEQNC